MELASLSSVLRGQARLQPHGFTSRDLGYLPSVQAIHMGRFIPRFMEQINTVRDKCMKKEKDWEESARLVRKASQRG